MPRTEIRSSNIIDNGLTGASFDPNIGIYDETKSYTEGDTVIWKSTYYKVTQNITGGQEGDLSNAPDVSASYDKIKPINKKFIEQQAVNGDTITFKLPYSDEKTFAIVYTKQLSQSGKTIDLSYFSQSSTKWNYEELFVSVDKGGISIKRDVIYDNVDIGGDYFKSDEIDTADYQGIENINVM
jgi:hypothetical protein